MSKLRMFMIFLLILLAAGGTFWHLRLKDRNNHELTLYGNIDIRQVSLGFRVPGRVEEMNFEEGDTVKPGQIMAILDKKPYIDELMLAKGELNNAQANFLRLKNGSRPQEIESAKALVQERETSYLNAVTLSQRQSCVKDIGAVAKQDFDDTSARVEETFALLVDAKERLSLAVEGFRYEDIKAGEAQVETAKARLELAETNLKDTEIICPSEGTILTRVREPGAVVDAGASVYSLSVKEPIWVRAYVNEMDLGKIYPGMQTRIYTDANPDKAYGGTIGFISPVAEFTPKNVETVSLRTDLVYRLRINIPKTDKYLRQGMPVTVKINLEAQNEQSGSKSN